MQSFSHSKMIKYVEIGSVTAELSNFKNLIIQVRLTGGKLKIATLTSREFSGKFSNLPCDSALPCLHLL